MFTVLVASVISLPFIWDTFPKTIIELTASDSNCLSFANSCCSLWVRAALSWSVVVSAGAGATYDWYIKSASAPRDAQIITKISINNIVIPLSILVYFNYINIIIP